MGEPRRNQHGRRRVLRSLFLIASLLLSASACQTSRPVEDYARFYELQPSTILVLPVENETTSAEAPTAFQSTIASPLIKRGYYTLPVLPTIEIMRAEGVYEGEQLREVPPQRYKELLGADAVLHITIHSWDTVYLILASGVSVSMTYELIETGTGETLWKDSGTRTVQSDSSGGLLAAAINAAVTALATEYVDLASQANAMALKSLPAGPHSEKYEHEREKYMRTAAEQVVEGDTESEVQLEP